MDLRAHAFLVRGNTQTLNNLLTILEKTGISTQANADFSARTFSSFSIDDARELRDKASLKALGKTGRIFVIVTPSIAPDAQNALLKTFEDPPEGAKFFLIVSSPETLLPTLRSRMQVLDVESKSENGLVSAEMFFKASPEKRIELIKPLLEKSEEDDSATGAKAGKRDMAAVLTFLSDLESILAEASRDNRASIEAVYLARKYVLDRGALVKPLLEQVALLA